jgi:hypothetical protein
MELMDDPRFVVTTHEFGGKKIELKHFASSTEAVSFPKIIQKNFYWSESRYRMV